MANVALGLASFFTSWLMFFRGFESNACDLVQAHLQRHLVGQQVAVQLLSSAVCDHLERPVGLGARKPLVLSLHGPPGVGKSFAHLLLAQSLYGVRQAAYNDCPGRACRGYRVVFGVDYLSGERSRQAARLGASLASHLRWYPAALIVVEEYDKIDCTMRGLLRQLLDGDKGTGSGFPSAGRAIVLLESNAGYEHLHRLAAAERGISAEAAQRALKDHVKYAHHYRLEPLNDAAVSQAVGLIDIFVPFLPLNRSHMGDLFTQHLTARQNALVTAQVSPAALQWSSKVISWLVDRVEFDGPFTIEGAKEVPAVLSRHATPALRAWRASQLQGTNPSRSVLPTLDGQRRSGAWTRVLMGFIHFVGVWGTQGAVAEESQLQGHALPSLPVVQLDISRDGRTLQAETVDVITRDDELAVKDL